jgi:hypothetical protein
VARLLTVKAFTRQRTGAARRSPIRDLRRPLTSCAHRLRKPDRTCELLALSVARWARGFGLRPAPRRAPKGGFRSWRLPRGTPRTNAFHRARSAVVAVGLERRPPDEPERLPSD